MTGIDLQHRHYVAFNDGSGLLHKSDCGSLYNTSPTVLMEAPIAIVCELLELQAKLQVLDWNWAWPSKILCMKCFAKTVEEMVDTFTTERAQRQTRTRETV